MSRGFITPTGDGILLNPIRLRVAAPPADGKANAERFLAELLGVPPSDVTAVRSASSRDKTVLVRNLEQAHTRKLLSTHLH